MNHNTYYQILLVITIMVINHKVLSQTSQEFNFEKCARLEVSYLYSTLNYQDIHSVKSGGAIQYSGCLKMNDRLYVGLGAGFQFLKNEAFIPFFLDIILFPVAKYHGFLNFQAGYSLGWSYNFPDYQDEQFSGGLHFCAGLGHKFRINEKFSIYLLGSYKNQFAQLEYQNELGEERNDRLHYNMLMINLGLMLEQR